MTTLQSADKSALDKLISSLKTPVFLAGIDEGSRPCLTLHTTTPGARRNLRRETERALTGAGIRGRCKVKEHGAERLAKDDSLEKLIRRFHHDSIVFDPTGCVSRAQAVMRCAKIIRKALGDGIVGIYLESWRRTLYVVLHRDAVLMDGEVASVRLREIETSLAAALRQGLGGLAGSFELVVRVGFGLPNIPVIPVDRASARAGRAQSNLYTKARIGSLAAVIAAFFGLGVAGSAMADGPAVSARNANLSAGGGATDGGGTLQVFGSATLPVGDNYGAQADVLLGWSDGDVSRSIGGHLFWRDPDVGLLGLMTSVNSLDSDILGRTAIEGELYRGRFTALARAGGQYGDCDDGGFGSLDLRWYGTDDFMLSAGGEVETGDFVARLGAEYHNRA